MTLLDRFVPIVTTGWLLMGLVCGCASAQRPAASRVGSNPGPAATTGPATAMNAAPVLRGRGEPVPLQGADDPVDSNQDDADDADLAEEFPDDEATFGASPASSSAPAGSSKLVRLIEPPTLLVPPTGRR